MRVRRASGATEGVPAGEHLASLARTAVAAGHGGLLTIAGGPSVNVGYLDDDGEPVIVCATSARRLSCAAFVTAEPDLWAAFGPAVAEHLSNVHGDVLVWMAARHLPHERVVAAAARRMRRTAIDLDVITPFGASRVEVALSAAPADPRELCALLRELTMDGPDGVEPAER